MSAVINRKFHGGLKAEESNFSSWRVRALVFFIFVFAAISFLRLYFIQIASFGTYKALADGQHNIFKKLIPERGEIFLKDKNGLYPAAVNKETKMAYAVPKEIKNPSDASSTLANILGIDENELRDELGNPEDMYEVLKHRLSDEEIQKIRDANIEGVHLADEAYRYYPSGELASQVLGFVGWKEKILGGQYGVEASFNQELNGKEGNIFQSRDSGGRWIPVGEKEIADAQNGDSLVLTIDHIVQYESEKLLESAVKKFDADNGSVIVMETGTGKILAMANYPSFDPNDYSKTEDIDVFRNPSVSDAYEPGSVFKAITLAAGVDSNKINPNTTYVDKGEVREAGYTIKNSDEKAYGVQTMSQVLEKSLNTGAIFVEKQLGNKNFSDYAKRFGFGELTNVGLVGESSGNLENLKKLNRDIQFFTASFGQGITVTPIQLVAAYNAIANGGILMKPQIVDKIIHSDGTEEEIKPQEVRRVISQRAAAQTTEMLRNVVTKGHGKRADVPGYLVGGKTGTAQVASSDSRGYEEGKTIGSFAGFAPTNNPKFTVLAKINNPKTVQWAESSVAPTFGELMRFLLEYYKVEPTEEYSPADLDNFNRTHTLRENFIKKNDEKNEEKVEN